MTGTSRSVVWGSAVFGFEGENAREKVIVLFTMCFALAMAMLDNTVVNVALPTISRELGAGVSELQWIVDGYVLVFALAAVNGRHRGRPLRAQEDLPRRPRDLHARLRALRPVPEHDAAHRGARVPGRGAALLMPGTLSIITVTFPPRAGQGDRPVGRDVGPRARPGPHRRRPDGRAPRLGVGLLPERADRDRGHLRGLAQRPRVGLRDHARTGHPRAVPGSGALFCATYALIEANEKGWSDPLIVSMLVVRSPGGRVPAVRAPGHAALRFFRIPAFSAGATVAFSVSFGMFATFFFMSCYMQLIRGYSVRGHPVPADDRHDHHRRAQRRSLRLQARFEDPPWLIWRYRPPAAVAHLDRHAVSAAGAGLRDDGHRDRATMAPMTAAGHERGGPRTRGPRLRHERTPRGGRRYSASPCWARSSPRGSTPCSPPLSGLGLPPTTQSAIKATAGHGTLSPSQLAGLSPEQQERSSPLFATPG